MFVSLMLFIKNVNIPPAINHVIHAEYMAMAVLYFILVVLALLDPVASWVVIFSHFINLVWAMAIIVLRYVIRRDINVDRRAMSDFFSFDRRRRPSYLNTQPDPDHLYTPEPK